MLTIENAFYDVAAVNNDTINTSNNYTEQLLPYKEVFCFVK